MAMTNSATAHAPTEVDLLFESIALEHLFIDTLQTRDSDRLDFHEVSVWGVKRALQAAFEAGRNAASKQAPQVHQAPQPSQP